MPVKLSETPMLYQPQPDQTKLERDLEMFSDPEQYDQDDPKLGAVKAEIRAMMDPGSQNQTDQTRDYLGSLLDDETEVSEALSPAPRVPERQ